MLMIPEPVISTQTPDWKQSLSKSFRTIQELLEYCELDVNCLDAGSEAGFPVRVTKYYATLIEKRNPLDPLLLQVIPDQQELRQIDGYTMDAVGDLKAMPVPGLIHKYNNRVLLTLTGACPVHCRYCFRRHFPYDQARLDIKQDSQAINYLKNHKEINEIILSGGDPLMLSDQKLASLIKLFNEIPHIRYLRFHSRLLSVLPERVTASFIQTLHQFKGRVTLITHINHPNELSELNQKTFRLLSQNDFHLYNQSVLLKRVNDNYDTLSELSYKLYDSFITPYYLHKMDKVHGTAHFDLPVDQICKIYTRLQNSLPGFLVPKLVNEISGSLSKTLIQCI